MTRSAMQADGWNRQIAQRDATLRGLVDRVAEGIHSGELDAVEAMLRTYPFAGATASGELLHTALTTGTSDGVALVSVERPATLLAVSVARLQTAGDLGGLVKLLSAAADRLRANANPDATGRARDLSLAALAYQLVRRNGDAGAAVDRAAELVLELGEQDDPATPPDQVVLAAVCDLAFAAFLVGDTTHAARLWNWVRHRVSDPRIPALMQADWGLGIVGTIIGVQDLVSPTMRRYLDRMRTHPAGPPQQFDPWWAMVTTARAWTELDRLDPVRALELTRVGVQIITTHQVISPLTLAHAFALVTTGRPRAAIEFLRTVPLESPGTLPQPSWQWRVMVFIVAGVLTGDEEAVAGGRALLQGQTLASALSAAYCELVRGRDVLTPLGSPPDPRFNARFRFLYWVIAAAGHAQRSADTAALEALEHVASIAETHPVAGVSLALPDDALQAVRSVAERAERRELLEHLPERSMVALPPRPVDLTPRESEVLRLLQRGLTNAEIARELFISPNTVKFHVANLLRRFGAATRDEVATRARTSAPRRSGRGDG